MMGSVLSRLVIMFIIIFMGFLIKKKNLISDSGEEGLQTVLLKVTFPCMLLMSMQREYTQKLGESFLKTFAAGIISVMVCFFVFLFIYKFILRAEDKKIGVFILSSAFGNVSFMGVPIAIAIYGEEALLASVAVIFAFNTLVFSAGVSACHIGENRGDTVFQYIKRMFFNVPMISIILGYIFFRFSVKVPETIGEALSSTGTASNVIALLIVGFALSKVRIKDLKDISIFAVIFFGLIGAPFIAKNVGGLILKDEVALGVLVIAAASPAATSTAAMASAEGKDGTLASKMIFISTLLYLVTMPSVIKYIL